MTLVELRAKVDAAISEHGGRTMVHGIGQGGQFTPFEGFELIQARIHRPEPESNGLGTWQDEPTLHLTSKPHAYPEDQLQEILVLW
jgi:hypothetical protein